MKTISIFCGFSEGYNPEFVKVAKEIGKICAEKKYRILTGGGNRGLMGAVTDGAVKSGGEVEGVIPETFQKEDVTHPSLSKLHVFPDLYYRKKFMIENTDAVLVLPGGLGTFDELFEVLVHTQLGLSTKPIGLLNIDNYFDTFMSLLDHIVKERMMKPEHKNYILIEKNPMVLIEKLSKFKIEFKKWW